MAWPAGVSLLLAEVLLDMRAPHVARVAHDGDVGGRFADDLIEGTDPRRVQLEPGDGVPFLAGFAAVALATCVALYTTLWLGYG